VGLVHAFARTAALVDGLEGYPVFLPPRSMGHAEFVEILERLARGWRTGVTGACGKDIRGKRRVLAIEAPPSSLHITTREETPDDEREMSESDTTGPPSSSSSMSSSMSSSSSTSTFVRSSSSSPLSSTHASPITPPVSPTPDPMLVENLGCARILLAPVVKRQRERAEEKRKEQAKGGKKNVPINIPMHGPRVEIILAWLGATVLSDLEAVA